MSKDTEQESTGQFWGSFEGPKTTGWAGFLVRVQAGKTQGNQIVRRLKFRGSSEFQIPTPEVDFNCPGATQIQGQRKEAMGVCVFRIQGGLEV